MYLESSKIGAYYKSTVEIVFFWGFGLKVLRKNHESYLSIFSVAHRYAWPQMENSNLTIQKFLLS